jgi:hypothetical protein
MEGCGGQLAACRLGASEPAPLPDVAIIFSQSGQHWLRSSAPGTQPRAYAAYWAVEIRTYSTATCKLEPAALAVLRFLLCPRHADLIGSAAWFCFPSPCIPGITSPRFLRSNPYRVLT